MLLEPETPLIRSAELDFGFPHASLVATYICYPEFKLSIGAAGLVSQSLSCKTLLAELGRLGFCQKCSLERLLLVFSRGCNCSKRGFWLKLVLVGGPETRNPV